ncbi:MAG: glycosyltransferase family 39 protein [Bacteroidetes bacterium]|nr:glycosyltransferase family 39 protein [Bacteroidota bacterium]
MKLINKEQWTIQKQENTFLAFVLFIAALLRFYHYSDFSITADEVSAIQRAQFSRISDLISLGVYTDTHPPFAQLLLFYWIKIFGISEASVRLPFVAMGTGSVYFFYKAAKNLFGTTSALLISAFIATSEFAILYSRLARPYSPGLFFSGLCFWMLTELFTTNPKNNYYFVFSIALAGSCYSHYFSALQAFLIGTLGIFFINKNQLIKYGGSCTIAIILLAPAYKIIIHQFGMKGLGASEGGWLAPPDIYFIKSYLLYCFSNSKLLLLVTGITACVGIFFLFKNKASSTTSEILKKQLFIILLFALPLAIGYIYSVERSPILQKSILLFSFPYLVLFIFSFVQNTALQFTSIVLLFISTLVTCYANKFYSTARFGDFKNISLQFQKNDSLYGAKNVSKAINVVGPYSIHYNFNRLKYRANLLSYINNGGAELQKYVHLLDTCNTNYFSFAWTTRYSPYEITEMIQDKFPKMLEEVFYFNSSYYLFSKKETEDKSISNPKYINTLEPSKEAPFWSSSNYLTDSATNQKYFILNEKVEYSPTFECDLKKIISSVNDIIHFKIEATLEDTTADGDIVLDFSRDGKNYSWQANKLHWFKLPNSNFVRAYISVTVPFNCKGSDILKAYVWNTSKKCIFIHQLRISVKDGNPLMYGKRMDTIN